jgi:hypothetical protein
MIHPLKVLCLVFMATLALAGISAGSASAEAVGSPQFTVETKFTGTIGKTKFGLSGAEVTCAKGTSEGSPTTPQSGSFTIDFKECKLGGSECHSLGDAKEVISMNAAYVLVRLKTEDPGVLIVVEETHVECAFLSTLALLRGGILGLVTPFKTKTTKYTDNENVKEGKQEFTEYENSVGEKEKVPLEGSVNGGEFKSATEESAEDDLTAAEETEIIETKGPLTIDVSPRVLTGRVPSGTYTIMNTSGTATPKVDLIRTVEVPRGSFTQNARELASCEKRYAVNERCSWSVRYVGREWALASVWYVDMGDRASATQDVEGTP